uniref:ERCC4 domain-containing protein n=1 Tax=Macrostomum lignano TaxID=282301 RepID=A0A1I8JFU1_9PLAT
MSSSLFVLDNNSTDSDGGPEGRRPPPPQASRLGPAAFDDEDDALFASVPMPDFANDDNAGLEAAAADPAVTGALSYGADCEQRPQRPAPSTVPKRQQNRPASSVQASSDETVYPVAQSTQLPSRQQHPHQTPKPKPPSSHRRSSSGKFPGPAGRLPRLKVPPDSGRGGQGVANAFVEAARKLNAAASAAAAAAAASRREERAATAAAGASAVVAASSQTSTISNASSSSGIDEEASWCAAAADLGPGLCRYLSRYSIAESLRLASSGQLPRNKVPAMLVIVETMDPTAVDCAASVKDATGRLQATLHRQVFRDLRDRVQPSAALVLRRVTLFSPDQRSYYLNITMDNIVRVYDRSGAPLQSNSSATAAASTLSNDEVQRLEAECLRPRTPPPKRVPESRYDVASDSALVLLVRLLLLKGSGLHLLERLSSIPSLISRILSLASLILSLINRIISLANLIPSLISRIRNLANLILSLISRIRNLANLIPSLINRIISLANLIPSLISRIRNLANLIFSLISRIRNLANLILSILSLILNLA